MKRFGCWIPGSGGLHPALGHNVRVLLAGREPPSIAWTIAREWHGLFHSLMLAPLTHADSMQFLRQAGVSKKIPPTWIGLRVDICLRSSSRRRRHSNIQGSI